MDTEQLEAQDHRAREWPLPRLVAFSTMVFTLTSFSIFAIIAVSLNLTQPDLGEQSITFPILGILLIAGTVMALIGLLAGVVDLVESQDRRGITVLSVSVNATACLLAFELVLTGFSTL